MYDERIRQFRDKAERNRIEGKPGLALDYTHAADAIEKLIEVIQNHDFLESLIKPRWIPVTERLPEEKRDGFSDDVLMLVENPDGDITWKDVYVGYYLYDATSAETGWWAMMTCDCVKIGEHKYGGKVFPANEYVTHWMPLPEPPKEET